VVVAWAVKGLKLYGGLGLGLTGLKFN
jgi:hypothetical protein